MNTGYEVTFKDFVRLLSDPRDRVEVAPLMREWFGYEIRPTAAGVALVDRSGAEVDPRAAHDAIQSDPERQGQLYRMAMTLWR